MATFHDATFRLLGMRPEISAAAAAEVARLEERLAFRLPASVREWYEYKGAIRILADHSNDDPPIALHNFALKSWESQVLLPIRYENQGVCTWAIALTGADDPPVLVDVDTGGREWHQLAPTFSQYVYSCVWDYREVWHQSALVQAQNCALSEVALSSLRTAFTQELTTHGWPGSAQYRFHRPQQAILIWSGDDQADWFVGARDANSLQAALKTVWHTDGVGLSFYDCSQIGRTVLDALRREM